MIFELNRSVSRRTAKVGKLMSVDRIEIVQKVASQLAAHPNATLPIIAERLGTTEQIIENTLHEIEGLSFQEFRANRRLEQAFKQLGEISIAANGPWEDNPCAAEVDHTQGYGQDLKPAAFGPEKADYSNQCPLVDISRDGLAWLADQDPRPKKRDIAAFKASWRRGSTSDRRPCRVCRGNRHRGLPLSDWRPVSAFL